MKGSTGQRVCLCANLQALLYNAQLSAIHEVVDASPQKANDRNTPERADFFVSRLLGQPPTLTDSTLTSAERNDLLERIDTALAVSGTSLANTKLLQPVAQVTTTKKKEKKKK